jgi:hypothetical protein
MGVKYIQGIRMTLYTSTMSIKKTAQADIMRDMPIVNMIVIINAIGRKSIDG